MCRRAHYCFQCYALSLLVAVDHCMFLCYHSNNCPRRMHLASGTHHLPSLPNMSCFFLVEFRLTTAAGHIKTCCSFPTHLLALMITHSHIQVQHCNSRSLYVLCSLIHIFNKINWNVQSCLRISLTVLTDRYVFHTVELNLQSQF